MFITPKIYNIHLIWNKKWYIVLTFDWLMTKLTPLGLAKILVVTISYQNIEAIYIYKVWS